MKFTPLRVLVMACLGTVTFGVRPVLAQAPAAAPQESKTADEVRQVRDEIDRLKKEFEAVRQLYDQRLSILEQRIGSLSGPSVVEPAAVAPAQPSPADQQPAPQQPPSAPPPEPPPAQPTPLASSQVGPGASKVFNPDTSVIGNFVGVAGDNPNNKQSPMELSEAEVAFQAVVDPYAKADFFLSASPEGLDVEEGYITFTSLPAGLLLKVGKMRAQFGKVNTMHSHTLPWVDRPLVTENLVGGEDGISDAGISLSKLIPNNFMFLEATGEVYSGHSNVFKSEQNSKLDYVGRVRAYRDLTEGTNLDLGGSFATGRSSWWPDFQKTLIGFDATFRYRPLRRAIYHRFIGRTEIIWSRHDMPAEPQRKTYGLYVSGDYQFARRWYLGGRYDRSGRLFDEGIFDDGVSAYMTFWPSEFSQIRGQYRYTNYAEGISANEFLFQFNFAIGAHGAHAF
jgi:hypothetical protein